MPEPTASATISLASWSRLWKRITTVAVMLTILLPTLWLLWNHIANQRLQSMIDQITARHEPLYPADFAPPPLPDDQNAATYLKAAALALNRQNWSPRSSNFTFPPYPPFGAQWQQMADASVKSNPQALALARQAWKFDRAIWEMLTSTSPVVRSTIIPQLNGARGLANLLADAAELAHIQGDDAEAIERLRDVLHEADSLNDNNVTLVSTLVSIGIDALAMSELQLIATDHLAIETARFPDRPPTTQPIIPVRRRVIVGLINQLLDEKKIEAALRRAFLSDRMMELDAIQRLADQNLLLRPMYKLEAARSLADKDIALAAAAQPNWPKASAIFAIDPLPPPPPPTNLPSNAAPRFSRSVTANFVVSLSRFAKTEFRVISERRMAAITLALQLYRADHGRWPAKLDELVPSYLPFVPMDPFMAEPTQMGYLLDKQSLPGGLDRPLLYVDESGHPSTAPPPMARCDSLASIPHDRSITQIMVASCQS
jgi:hypothetical protein